MFFLEVLICMDFCLNISELKQIKKLCINAEADKRVIKLIVYINHIDS